jgi:hypothetical protein
VNRPCRTGRRHKNETDVERSERSHTTSATCETELACPDAACAHELLRGGCLPSSCHQHVRTVGAEAQPSARTAR